MKNNHLITIYNSFSKLDIGNSKFKFFIGKNKKILFEEIKVLEECLKTPDKYQDFEDKRIELAKKYSIKGENGEPIIENNNFKLKDTKSFNKGFIKLQEEYKEVLEQFNKNKEDYNKLLNEESKIELIGVSEDNLPNDCSQGIIDILIEFDLIK